MNSKIFLFLVIGCNSLFRICLAHESLEQILSDEGCKAQYFTEERIYINPLNIHIRQEGLFYEKRNGDFIQLPNLFSDSSGCYVLAALSSKITKKCPFCGQERISGIFKCPNPECSSNKKTKIE